MYALPANIETRIFTRLPDELQVRNRHSDWFVAPGIDPLGSILEGPSFDRAGNLYCVDIPWGRVFRIAPDGKFTLVAEYDGEPNGLKIHKDGRIFIADQKNGIMLLDPAAGRVTPVMDRYGGERLRGPNDLVFASNGDLYFTDQGKSALNAWTGRVFCIRANGKVDLVLDEIPSPNGLVLSLDEKTLFLAVTRTNSVWRVPLLPNGQAGKVGNYIQLSGGIGPDGLAMDEAGNLFIAHTGIGSVWVFNPVGEPIYRLPTCVSGRSTTNLAFGGRDGKTLFITESRTGSILCADLAVRGRVMYSHM